MILDEFRKKNQRNRTSDEGHINSRRWLLTEIIKVFWRAGEHMLLLVDLVHVIG
jgi:hypothetical protein